MTIAPWVQTHPFTLERQPTRVRGAAQAPAGVFTDTTHADRQFVQMLRGYRSSGGLLRIQDLARQFQRQHGPDATTLARWLAARQIIGIDWHQHTWLPMFQFDPVRLAPLPSLVPVFGTLTPLFDAWELAEWFSRPSSWLKGRAPADLIRTHAHAVTQAARADQMIAGGR